MPGKFSSRVLLHDGIEKVLIPVLSTLVGSEAIVGFIIEFLDSVTPDMCLEYIRRNKQLVSLDDVRRYKKYARMVKFVVEFQDAKKAVEKLAEKRPDLAGVIINHPDGMKWLQSQIDVVVDEITTQEVQDAAINSDGEKQDSIWVNCQ